MMGTHSSRPQQTAEVRGDGGSAAFERAEPVSASLRTDNVRAAIAGVIFSGSRLVKQHQQQQKLLTCSNKDGPDLPDGLDPVWQQQRQQLDQAVQDEVMQDADQNDMTGSHAGGGFSGNSIGDGPDDQQEHDVGVTAGNASKHSAAATCRSMTLKQLIIRLGEQEPSTQSLKWAFQAWAGPSKSTSDVDVGELLRQPHLLFRNLSSKQANNGSGYTFKTACNHVNAVLKALQLPEVQQLLHSEQEVQELRRRLQAAKDRLLSTRQVADVAEDAAGGGDHCVSSQPAVVAAAAASARGNVLQQRESDVPYDDQDTQPQGEQQHCCVRLKQAEGPPNKKQRIKSTIDGNSSRLQPAQSASDEHPDGNAERQKSPRAAAAAGMGRSRPARKAAAAAARAFERQLRPASSNSFNSSDDLQGDSIDQDQQFQCLTSAQQSAFNDDDEQTSPMRVTADCPHQYLGEKQGNVGIAPTGPVAQADGEAHYSSPTRQRTMQQQQQGTNRLPKQQGQQQQQQHQRLTISDLKKFWSDEKAKSKQSPYKHQHPLEQMEKLFQTNSFIEAIGRFDEYEAFLSGETYKPDTAKRLCGYLMQTLQLPKVQQALGARADTVYQQIDRAKKQFKSLANKPQAVAAAADGGKRQNRAEKRRRAEDSMAGAQTQTRPVAATTSAPEALKHVDDLIDQSDHVIDGNLVVDHESAGNDHIDHVDQEDRDDYMDPCSECVPQPLPQPLQHSQPSAAKAQQRRDPESISDTAAAQLPAATATAAATASHPDDSPLTATKQGVLPPAFNSRFTANAKVLSQQQQQHPPAVPAKPTERDTAAAAAAAAVGVDLQAAATIPVPVHQEQVSALANPEPGQLTAVTPAATATTRLMPAKQHLTAAVAGDDVAAGITQLAATGATAAAAAGAAGNRAVQPATPTAGTSESCTCWHSIRPLSPAAAAAARAAKKHIADLLEQLVDGLKKDGLVGLDAEQAAERYDYLVLTLHDSLQGLQSNTQLEAAAAVLSWLLLLPSGSCRELMIDMLRTNEGWFDRFLMCWSAEVQLTGCAVQQAEAAAEVFYVVDYTTGCATNCCGSSDRCIKGCLAGLCQLMLSVLKELCKACATKSNALAETSNTTTALAAATVAATVASKMLVQQTAEALLAGTEHLIMHDLPTHSRRASYWRVAQLPAT